MKIRSKEKTGGVRRGGGITDVLIDLCVSKRRPYKDVFFSFIETTSGIVCRVLSNWI